MKPLRKTCPVCNSTKFKAKKEGDKMLQKCLRCNFLNIIAVSK